MKPATALLTFALLLPAPAVFAADPSSPKPATTKPATKQAAAKPRPAAKAKPAATPAASAVPEAPLSPGQLAAAERVHTGRADCEFGRSVEVEPAPGRPGHFDVRLGARHFLMVPQETSTGAVRLHDRRSDVVWLQIPSKSMMMDNRAGQRLVDACLHAAQRSPAVPMHVAENEILPQAPGRPAEAGR